MRGIEMRDEKRLIRSLIIVTVTLIFLNIINMLFGGPSWEIDRFINMDFEMNFPTWFSSLIWAIAAFMAYKCYEIAKIKGSSAKIWGIVSFTLLFLSLDEVATIHEHLGKFINRHSFDLDISASPVVFLGPIALFIMIVFIITLRRHLKGSKQAARLLLIGLGLVALGALALEHTLNFIPYKQLGSLRTVEVIFEESLEMFGAILIIAGLVEHRKFLYLREIS